MSETGTIDKKDLIYIRTFDPTDLHFILVTWLRALYEDNETFKLIKKRTYYQNYEPIIKKMIDRPYCFILVAALQQNPSVIIGWACFSYIQKKYVLDFIYIKPLWRGIGLASDLCKNMKIKTCTHITKKGLELKPKNMFFNPFQI